MIISTQKIKDIKVLSSFIDQSILLIWLNERQNSQYPTKKWQSQMLPSLDD